MITVYLTFQYITQIQKKKKKKTVFAIERTKMVTWTIKRVQSQNFGQQTRSTYVTRRVQMDTMRVYPLGLLLAKWKIYCYGLLVPLSLHHNRKCFTLSDIKGCNYSSSKKEKIMRKKVFTPNFTSNFLEKRKGRCSYLSFEVPYMIKKILQGKDRFSFQFQTSTTFSKKKVLVPIM